MKNRSRRFILV